MNKRKLFWVVCALLVFSVGSTVAASVTIVNGDFELDGVDNAAPPAGWTDNTPTSFWTGVAGEGGNPTQIEWDSAPSPGLGSYILTTARTSAGAGSQPTNGQLVQTVNLSVLATEIDAGTKILNVDFIYGSDDFRDTGIFSLHFFSSTDGSGTELGSGYSVALDDADGNAFTGWLETTVGGLVPVGTRSVTLQIDTTRSGGTETNLWIDNISLRDAASNPSPADGATGVGLSATLSWDAPSAYSGATYNVYFGTTEPNFTVPAPYNLTQTGTAGQSATTATPLSPMVTDATYYWVVDTLEPNDVAPYTPILHQGAAWSFSTIPSSPILTPDQPASVRVFPADGAVFTVDFTSISTPSVEWYKIGAPNILQTTGVTTTDNGGGSYTTTLDLGMPVDVSDEGQYFCRVTNDGGSTWYDSATVANLVIKRELANYAFDVDLTDSSANGAPTGTAMDSLGDPNTLLHVTGTVHYLTGADGIGNALYLDPNEYINFGVEGYPKANPATSNGLGGGLDEGTIIVWIKPVNDGSQTILAGLNGGATDGFQSQLQSDGDHRVYIRDENGNNHENDGRPSRPEYDPNDGNWHMMAACWSGNSTTIYVDGQWTSNNTGGTVASFGPWQYGVLLGSARQSSDRSFLADTFAGGAIDNLRIYNYRLDADSTEVFAQEYLDNTTIHPCTNLSFAGNAFNHDNTGSSYCKVDMADFAMFAGAWLADGLY